MNFESKNVEFGKALRAVSESVKLIKQFLHFFIALIATSFIPLFSFALDLPDYQMHYEKKTGKVIGIVNNTADRKTKVGITSRSASLAKLDESEAIQAADKFLIEKGSLLGIKNVSTELSPTGVREDRFGFKILRYEQRVKGVPVFGSEIVAQVNSSNEVLSTSGRILENVDIDVNPQMSFSRAIIQAKRDMEMRYGWKATIAVQKRRLRKDCRNESLNRSKKIPVCIQSQLKKFEKANGFYSNAQPKLYIYNESFEIGNDDFAPSSTLAWNVLILNAFGDSEEFFVEANHGNILKYHETKHSETYRRVLDCSNFLGDGLCYSQKSSPQYPGYIFGRKGSAPERGPNPVPGALFGSTDVDEIFNILPDIHNFYLTKFYRDGGNDLGGIGDVSCPVGQTCVSGSGPAYVNETHIYVNINGTTPAACTPGGASFQWNPPGLNFCRDSDSLDTIGHEYAHTVARFNSFNPNGTYNSVLIGSGQSGALNESNSDIMGEAFEVNMTGSNDWIFPTGSTTPPLRNLSNPPALTHTLQGAPVPFPDNYNSPNFYCGAEDSGGVHINTTIPSKAAYLASAGGSHNGCEIQGIGLHKVEQIWYRALTTYYTASTTFNQAYFGLTQACQDFVALPNAFADFNPPFQITQADCDNVAKALQSVEMDQAGGCNGSVPANNDFTPTCLDLPPDYSGDFNSDEVIDLWDYNVLRSQWGNTGAGHTADANSDNVVDVLDYNIWLEDFTGGNAPPAPTITGDCDYDSDVDGADFLAWQRSIGLTGPALDCDLNVDGTVDAADYTVWRDNFGAGA